MRYVVATLMALLTLFSGALLSAAGHGWNAGAIGCFALAPISFFACRNALSPKPSRRAALAFLSCGMAVCLLVAVGTVSYGVEYFYQFFRINGMLGASVAAFALLGWLLPSSLVFLRERSSPRLGK